MNQFLLLLLAGIFLFTACGPSTDDQAANNGEQPKSMLETETTAADDGKGIGEIKEVTLETPLNEQMIAEGKAIYEMKCSACHKLTAERVVGPGWEGITERRKPEWIMNMITNVDVMLEEDPAARQMLEECLVRMPNQNISVGDARSILEFMRQNDEKG